MINEQGKRVKVMTEHDELEAACHAAWVAYIALIKHEELKAAWDPAYAAFEAARDAAEAYGAAVVKKNWDAYYVKLKKKQEENSNGYDQVQEGDGSTV
jgi:hypothetical protein